MCGWGLGVILLLLGAVALPGPAAARNLALLVGVAAYDEPKIRPLTGPRNDVVLLWRHLVRHDFAPADIEVLAEGLPPADDVPRPLDLPVRAAILAGLERLAARAGPGDLVLFHFSGHGTTQPQPPGAADELEAGGRDQVLLPKDAGLYDPATQTIRNAIVDNELGAALDRIRATGATVWVIVDACHAGSVTRSADIARSVQPEALGVPAPQAAPAPGNARAPERSGTLGAAAAEKGPLIAFFAVDAWTQAIERPHPGAAAGLAAGPGGEPTFGVFTWHLLRALESGRARSFRDLARQVSLDISAAGRIAQAPLPVFEGDLDRPLPGAAADRPPRFPARRDGDELVIEAGALQGFDLGAGIGLYDGPLADARRRAGAELTASAAGESRAGLPQAAGSGELWVEMERPAVVFRFRVAGVDEPAAAEAVARALGPPDGRSGAPALGIELVAAGEPADLRLHLADDRLWLVPDGRPLVRDAGAYGRSFSLPWPAAAPPVAQLRNAVWAYARAANLVRIASAAELGGGGAGDDIEISLERVRETDPARLADPRRACATAAQPSAPLPVDGGTAAAVAHCDTVRLAVANRSDRDVDIGVFFLDPLAGIGVPVRDWRQNGCIATIPARAAGPMVVRTTLRTWSGGGPSQIGLHRILVFALPRHGGIPPSLCHLLQGDASAAAAGAAALRSAGRGGFLDLLGRAALADPALRAANPFAEDEGEAKGVVVRQFTLDLLPPEAGR